MATPAIATAVEPRAGGGRSFAFVDLYRATPMDRVAAIKAGVPARRLKQFVGELKLDQRTVFDALGLKTAIVNKKTAGDETLSADESERVLGLAKLIGQLEAMLDEPGDPAGFDATACCRAG